MFHVTADPENTFICLVTFQFNYRWIRCWCLFSHSVCVFFVHFTDFCLIISVRSMCTTDGNSFLYCRYVYVYTHTHTHENLLHRLHFFFMRLKPLSLSPPFFIVSCSFPHSSLSSHFLSLHPSLFLCLSVSCQLYLSFSAPLLSLRVRVWMSGRPQCSECSGAAPSGGPLSSIPISMVTRSLRKTPPLSRRRS